MPQKLSYPVVRTAKITFNTNTHGDSIIPLIENFPEYVRGKFPLVIDRGVCNGYIKKLKVFADCPNLPETPLPQLPDSASDMERFAAQRQIEWHSPRFHLMIWGTKKVGGSNRPSDGDWMELGYHSIINTGVWRQYEPFDFLTTNIADEIEEGDRLGFSIIPIEVGGNTYFPRTNPPYTLPANRADKITIDVGWVQELLVAQPDKEPVVIYVQGTSTAGTATTPTNPPQVTVSGVTGSVYISDTTNITLSLSQLTANQDFFLGYVVNGSVLKTDTIRPTATTHTINIAPSSLSQYGSGDYKFRITQGNLSVESSTVRVLVPSLSFSATSASTSSSVPVNIYDLRVGTAYSISWIKDNVEVPNSSTNYTFLENSGQNFNQKIFNGSQFQNAPYSIPGTYKAKLTVGNFSVTSSNTCYISATSTGGAKG